MADPGKVYPMDVHLLKTEIQVHGEILSQERLERKAEVDELRLEIAVLKKLLEEVYPDFQSSYSAKYREQRETFDPEKRRNGTTG